LSDSWFETAVITIDANVQTTHLHFATNVSKCAINLCVRATLFNVIVHLDFDKKKLKLALKRMLDLRFSIKFIHYTTSGLMVHVSETGGIKNSTTNSFTVLFSWTKLNDGAF